MFELSLVLICEKRLITHRPKGTKKRVIRIFMSDQDVPTLPANSKGLKLTRNGFIERSNHMEVLIILYLNSDNKQVANRKLLCGRIV